MHTLDDLRDAGLIDDVAAARLAPVAARYAVAITPAMAALIEREGANGATGLGRADPADPIALQFIPDVRELDHHPAELADPIGDHGKTVAPGVVHRYPDRVLLKLSGVCPVYCRFCFRREMVGPGAGRTLTPDEVADALAYIAATPAIFEVILTGGDPLILSPRRIREIGEALSAIPHVKIVRWHTRVPVVTPDRVTDDMTSALRAPRQPVYIAIHANHPRELTAAARIALARLADAGIGLVSQSVLLRGVNDDVETLERLMRGFLECRVLPYYLHHGDLAPGTGHFRTPIAKGQAIIAELRRRMSGLAQPRYVLDIPGAHGKVTVEASSLAPSGAGAWRIVDPAGRDHHYAEAVRDGDETTATQTAALT